MRLRTKLSIVLAMLVSTLVTNVGLSVWSIRFLEKELSAPLHSMQSVMLRLHQIKRSGEREIDLVADLVGGSQTDEILQVSDQISEAEVEARILLDELESLPGVMLRSGVNAVKNLKGRSTDINRFNDQWSASLSDSDARILIAQIDARHELIERIEGRILEDARLAADFGDSLRTRVYSSILVTLVGALTIGVLMVLFIRGWIFTPIEQLRAGASRMAMGNFGQPIDVQSADELGQLSGEFNRMGVLIQAMQEQKIESERLSAIGEMAQRTAHNFRTPLAGIRALSETTRDELEEDSDLRDFQSRIISTVDRFEIWLNDMLRTSSPLNLEMIEFSPHELIESIVGAHRAAAESKDLVIALTDDSTSGLAKGDTHHLGHAITAVLSNAIDFAPGSSTIEVRIGSDVVEGVGYWTLKISNDGPMIPTDLHRSIFRPYFTTRPTGTGIGLAMSHRVVHQHSGRIEVESPLNATAETGCAFLMLIPMGLG
jgi:signal transduction histidine kinase